MTVKDENLINNSWMERI